MHASCNPIASTEPSINEVTRTTEEELDEMDVTSDTQAGAVTSESNTEEEGRPDMVQDLTDHKWDDLLRAIDEDLRAFWGLWNTVILPRLNPNIPTDFEVMKGWNGDGVDMTDVWVQTEDLQAQVKQLLDKRPPKPREKGQLDCLNDLVTSRYPVKDKAYFQWFVSRIMRAEAAHGYPMPVN